MNPLARIIDHCDTDESAVRELKNRGWREYDAWQMVKSQRAVLKPVPVPVSISYARPDAMTKPMRRVMERLAVADSAKVHLIDTTSGLSRRDVYAAIEALDARGWVRLCPRAKWGLTQKGRDALRREAS
jgi:hypothetical protein